MTQPLDGPSHQIFAQPYAVRLAADQRLDVLTGETFAAMKNAVPAMVAVTVSGVGHAPTLAEPEVVEALDNALQKADDSLH